MNKSNTPPTSHAYIALFSETAPSWMARLEEEWGNQFNQLVTLQGASVPPPASDPTTPPAAMMPTPVASPDLSLLGLGWLGTTVPPPTVPTPHTETAPPGLTPPSETEGGAGVQEEVEANTANGEGSKPDETPPPENETATDAPVMPQGEASEDVPTTPTEGTPDDSPKPHGSFGF